MAVDSSHRLRSTASQVYHPPAAHLSEANPAGAAAAAIDAPSFWPTHHCYGGEVFAGGVVPAGKGYNPSSYLGEVVALTGPDQHSHLLSTLDTRKDHVVMFEGTSQQLANNKRRRVHYSPVPETSDDLGAAQTYPSWATEINRAVLNYTAPKTCPALVLRTQRHMRLIATAIEAKAAKLLQNKVEEIERLKMMNWALQERLRTLSAEYQAWRDVAQSNEVVTNILRNDLELALKALTPHQVGGGGESNGFVDDAESHCCGDEEVEISICGEEIERRQSNRYD